MTKVIPYKTKYLSIVTLAFIDKFYSEKTSLSNQSCVTEKIIQNPVMVIDVFLKRLTENLEKVRFEKQLKLDEWKQCCEINFLKSLDHRSFFFKESQKKKLQSKYQVEELRKISLARDKNINQMKGGTKNSEFFCTYSSLQMNNQQTYPDEALKDPNLLADSPINLLDPEILSRPDLLPQMRFFFYDNEVLELTFQTLLAGCRLGNYPVADRTKMESILELFITKFFKIDF